LIGGGLAVTLAVLLAQRLGHRIQELERRTRAIAAGDFSPMPLPSRNDELRDLSRSVNDMASRLALLQDAIRQTERLRLLGQVSAGLAHTLRNGVTGARLAVQLHARHCDEQGDAEALDVALRQLALVESNLKQFLDQGRDPATLKQPCNLTQCLDHVTGLVKPQCRHAGIELRWQPPADAYVIQGNASQLEHLLLNLVHNAIDAAGPGGWVEVSIGKTEKNVVIEIADSGSGPPPEVAGRLFDLFVTGKREGVGLGLALAKQVAEAHGGRIDWRHEAGRTCFRVELPA
jgi:signal transduction histidine kinase